MSNLRTAAQQALEYMKSGDPADMYPEEWMIVERLEAALAQEQAEPVDDILRMAREAGFGWDEKYHWYVSGEQLKRFAALVRADEREACAKVCDDKAKETFSGQCQVWGDYFARAIRARGDK